MPLIKINLLICYIQCHCLSNANIGISGLFVKIGSLDGGKVRFMFTGEG